MRGIHAPVVRYTDLALVAELAVALVGTVLPGFARVDQGGVDLGFGQPLQDPVADEFRTVIRTQVGAR